MGGGARIAPFGMLMNPKDGCAQRKWGKNPRVINIRHGGMMEAAKARLYRLSGRGSSAAYCQL
jgi:hypothetical protein